MSTRLAVPRAMRLRAVVASAIVTLLACAFGACGSSQECPPTGVPCFTGETLDSPCGFQSVSGACAECAGRDARGLLTQCGISFPSSGQPCTITAVFGDGTTHTRTFTLRNQTCGCALSPDDTGWSTDTPVTCPGFDAGPADAAADGSADATGE